MLRRSDSPSADDDLGAESSAPTSTRQLAFIVTASAAGTAFEWYDFFIFIPLAGIIAKMFFAGLNEAAAYLFALLAFAAGFAFRPIGALIFGRLGDRMGRKSVFLITISMMGFATFAIGLLPTYREAGILAPALFMGLRVVQGLALGGEWGGAAIYVAEHSPPTRRGLLTGWIGASSTLGLGAALIVTFAARTTVGESAFAEWGWRIPFLSSAVLLAASLWIRVRLHESPMFKKIQADGSRSEAPYVESFLRWPALRLVLIALFGVMVAQGAVWYCVYFYAQFFMEHVIKVAPSTVNLLMIAVAAATAPLYVLFGALSDVVGRKPVMIAGMALAAAAFFPGYHALSHLMNPALVAAQRTAPVSVSADPASCHLQFDPVGAGGFRSSCDIAKGALASDGVSYANLPSPPGAPAQVRIGKVVIVAPDGARLSKAALQAVKTRTQGEIIAALRAAGYPPQAAPDQTNTVGAFFVLVLFAVGAAALYGPQAAALVELFPTRIRYTALSFPYHIGIGWVGGFLPAAAYAMVTARGDIYFGLWYPVAATIFSALVALVFLPETHRRDLNF
jgi:MFS family permease